MKIFLLFLLISYILGQPCDYDDINCVLKLDANERQEIVWKEKEQEILKQKSFTDLWGFQLNWTSSEDWFEKR